MFVSFITIIYWRWITDKLPVHTTTHFLSVNQVGFTYGNKSLVSWRKFMKKEIKKAAIMHWHFHEHPPKLDIYGTADDDDTQSQLIWVIIGKAFYKFYSYIANGNYLKWSPCSWWTLYTCQCLNEAIINK